MMAAPETPPNATISNETQAAGGITAMDVMYRLINCASKGDWKGAKNIIEGDLNIKNQVTSTGTGLYIMDWAALGGEWDFFNEMLQQLTNAETLLTTPYDHSGQTILLRVATCRGSMKSAKALVEKCPSLTQMIDSMGMTPLLTAMTSLDTDLVWYLALVTSDQQPGCPFTGPHAANLLYILLSAGYYDTTLFLLQKHPRLAQILLTAHSAMYNQPALAPLALRPDDFPSGAKFGWLVRCLYSLASVDVGDCKPPSHVLQEFGDCSSSTTNRQLRMQISEIFSPLQRIRDMKFKHECVVQLVKIACRQTKWSPKGDNDPDFQMIIVILAQSVASGIIEILSIYMQFFPLPLHSLAYRILLLEAAVARQDNVFNFLLRKHPECNANFYMDGMNTLHMVAKFKYCHKIASIAGAAFQMQKELQWFKGIEKLVSPFARQQPSVSSGQTPWELFREEHKDMQKEGEKWMKNTSNSCMLVATLIATVVFAAAFTVPGGNNQDTGTPILLHSNTFMLFAVFDALALFSSINSLWMFLSILTAHFAQEDFVHILPKRLIFGLATLFLAIVSSIIAFGAALSLVLGHRQNEVIIFIILMALTSVAMFAILQLPLFIEMVRSTYCRKLLGS